VSAALDPRRNLHEIAVGRAKRKERRTRYASYTSSLEWREYSNGLTYILSYRLPWHEATKRASACFSKEKSMISSKIDMYLTSYCTYLQSVHVYVSSFSEGSAACFGPRQRGFKVSFPQK